MYVEEHFVELLNLIYEGIQEYRWQKRSKFCVLYGSKDMNGCNCLQKEQIESIATLFKEEWFKNSTEDFKTIDCNGRKVLSGHLNSKFNTTDAIGIIIKCLSGNSTNIKDMNCDICDLQDNALLILILLCMCIMYTLDTDETLIFKQQDIDTENEIRPCLYALIRRILQQYCNRAVLQVWESVRCDDCLNGLSEMQDLGNSYDIILHYIVKTNNFNTCIGNKLQILCGLYEQVQKFLLAHLSATWLPILNYSFMAFITKVVFLQKSDILHDRFMDVTVVEGL